MKLTLPNGIIIEGELEEVKWAMDLVDGNKRPEVATNPDPPAVERHREALNTFTAVQRQTFDIILRSGRRGISVPSLADVLGIGNSAASQRALVMVKLGVAERVRLGVYRIK